MAEHATPPRLTTTRLAVSLRRSDEALSPRALRKLLADLQAVANPSLSDVEAGRLAQALAHWHAQADEAERLDFYLLLAEQFVPDVEQIGRASEGLSKALGTAEQGAAEVRFRRALASPRAKLLQRFAAYDEGMAFLVQLRALILPLLRKEPRLLPLDAELELLFTRWFEMGSLRLERISWDSPASLIEKLIQYEAVHDIKSWADVKNRLDADRRCYGFFHPRLPAVPLIFVEVAFGRAMADAMAPLLDEHGDAADLAQATHAVFYSISNTQTGLKGVSFGDALIKRVVGALQGEFPQLKHFATLSPMPGFAAWLKKSADAQWADTPAKLQAALAQELADGAEDEAADALSAKQVLEHISALDGAALADLPADSARRSWLTRMAATYLSGTEGERPLDAVARFHLGNGARVERLNWAADLSAKGIKQSWGLMVNYCYDLKRLDQHREALAKGKVTVSKAVQAVLA